MAIKNNNRKISRIRKLRLKHEDKDHLMQIRIYEMYCTTKYINMLVVLVLINLKNYQFEKNGNGGSPIRGLY